MTLFLVAYDIASDRRRRRVAAVLERKGRRLQRSVFEIRMDPDALPDLRRQLGLLLHPKDDLDILPVDERQGQHRWKWQRPVPDWPAFIRLKPPEQRSRG